MDFEEYFLTYYKALVNEFARELSTEPVDQFVNVSQPFLPLFGDQYEQAKVRIVFVGIETRGWGDAKDFIQNINCAHRDEMDAFRTLQFADWTNNFGYTFFDFIMFFLGTIHGLPDWKVLKRRLNDSVLKTFAWGNCSAVEGFNILSKSKGAEYSAWKKIKDSSIRFDKAEHVVHALKPDAIVVLNKGMNPEYYFSGLNYEAISNKGDVAHFFLKTNNVHVFRVPHPSNMRYDKRKKEYFAQSLVELFAKVHLDLKVPSFVRDIRESEQFIRSLVRTIPKGLNKYGCISWIAEKLVEQDSVMSVPTLIEILNNAGHETDYGEKFVGGRGSYKLVQSAYSRCDKNGQNATAQAIASAYVKPNGEYAYHI